MQTLAILLHRVGKNYLFYKSSGIMVSMKKKSFAFFILIVSLIIGFYLLYRLFGYFGLLSKFQPSRSLTYSPINPLTHSPDNPISPFPMGNNYTITPVATGLFVPWSIVFTSADRILITERNGAIREVKNGALNFTPLITFSEVSQTGEEGLMGLAKDPNYNSNNRLYACLAYEENEKLFDKVVALTDNQSSITLSNTLIDTIPAAKFHAGCRIKFGPDEKLYITTGDATDKSLPQNIDSVGGKILRINADGSIPADNPFPNSPVYSYGHRNPQGIDWHPGTYALIETEHGPSLIDGPAGGDEVNEIVKGGNYGWPLVSHENTKEGTVPPLLLFTPAEAPASGAFFVSENPNLNNNYFFGALVGKGILRVVLSESSPHTIHFYEKLTVNKGRIRDVIQSPDGALYFTTSNRDGRGKPGDNDDALYKLEFF
jgi:glucose/arabinose dehydrogenase